MADTITLKPAPGRRVRDPATMRVLAEGGEAKPVNSYWLRRVADGDVLEVTEVPAPAPEPVKPTRKSTLPVTPKE